MRKVHLCLLLLLSLLALFSKAQNADSTLPAAKQIPGKYYTQVGKKYSSIEEGLSIKSVKYLEKLQRQEKKMQHKMIAFDSSTSLFAGAQSKYDSLITDISKKENTAGSIQLNQYNSYLDTLSTSLSFLKKYGDLTGKVKLPMAALNQLKSKLNQTDKIKDFIAERRKQVQEMLAKYTKLPASLKEQYERLSKTTYYYTAQVKEYKEMLHDPKKIEEKTIALLNKIPAFQKFFKQNSQLASLFRLPDNYGTAQNLKGLQTRSSVQQIVQQRIASGGPNAQAEIQQNLEAAHAVLNKLKDKINKLGGGSSEIEMPDFKPNEQKTKSFLKRLEYTTDVQFGKTNNLLPSAANIGLGAGYKLNDKSIIGIGMSYKMGMGSIQHISFTHQGIGFRSYGDYKIKGSLFISGGYEMNYNSAFKNVEELKHYNSWQRSALLGISKKYKISKKVKGEMKILYDFLANQHIPVSQPVIYRIGYKI